VNVNLVFATWLVLYGLAVIAVSPWGFRRQIFITFLAVICLGTLIFQLRESAALGDSGFYLGQAKSSLETGRPRYPLANIRSAAFSGVIMNLIITYIPRISQFYSPLFVVPFFALLGRKRQFQTILFLCSTALIYFLKPNYMDFYPAAITIGSIAILFHFRTFDGPGHGKVTLAGATAGIAIASHLILLMIPISWVVHLILQRNSWRKRSAQVFVYLLMTYLFFWLSIFLLSQMNWPMYPGNSTGGSDNKYLATPLINGKQIIHAIRVACVTLFGPVVFVALSRNKKSLTKYLPFMSPIIVIYLSFLFIYGFDLGLVPDLDLQLFPGAIILSAFLIIAAREKIVVTWLHGVCCLPIVVYSAHMISTIPK
jgi:hypothetical protein